MPASPGETLDPYLVAPRPGGTAHVVGGGPVGMFLAALLQGIEGQRVRIYEKRSEYTRTRMVSLAPYLVADSIETYQADPLDGPNVAAIFDTAELETRLAYRRTVAPDLRALLEAWTRGFVALNTIERTLDELIRDRDTGTVERVTGEATRESVLAAAGPGDIVVDCTGTRSLFRDALVPGGDEPGRRNLYRVRMEHALVVTFLYSRHYTCSEWCKYDKNVGNTAYKFIPGVRRTFYDGSISYLTGFVTISREEFQAMPPEFDGAWLRAHYPAIAASMDRFIANVQEETHGEVVGDIEIVRIPLEVYHAHNVTSRPWRAVADGGPLSTTPVLLLGDAAIGSPYFQSISLGFECAFFVAGHIGNPDLPMAEVFDRYESFMHRQWLRVHTKTRMIKHNKDLLQVADDPRQLLSRLHIF